MPSKLVVEHTYAFHRHGWFLRGCWGNAGIRPADVETVLRACAKYGVPVEINAHPWRLDLDWRWHQAALDFGCMMSIKPDAHSIRELDHMHWGVEMARKGGVPAGRVLNALSLSDIAHYFERKRRRLARAA